MKTMPGEGIPIHPIIPTYPIYTYINNHIYICIDDYKYIYIYIIIYIYSISCISYRSNALAIDGPLGPGRSPSSSQRSFAQRVHGRRGRRPAQDQSSWDHHQWTDSSGIKELGPIDYLNLFE